MGDSNWDTKDMGKLLSSKAVQFIRKNADSEKPFFLYYCSPMVHRPHIPTNEFDGQKIKGATVTAHLDMVVDFDMQIKRIVDALKATGELNNTLFVLTSDNGGLQDGPASKKGYQPSGEFNGSKNSPLEGGHRVPTFAVWPGKIDPGVCDELVVNQDFVATFAALVGTEIPKGQAQDSNNILPLLTGNGTFKPRRFFAHQAGSQHEFMLRVMPWKLVIQSNHKRAKMEPKLLFNLQDDPRERNNLIDKPEMKDRIGAMLKQYKVLIETKRATVAAEN
jgi:arylsulfatase A-like enzyme